MVSVEWSGRLEFGLSFGWEDCEESDSIELELDDAGRGSVLISIALLRDGCVTGCGGIGFGLRCCSLVVNTSLALALLHCLLVSIIKTR